MVLAVSPSYQQQPVHRTWLEELERRDPRLCSLTTPLALAERQLERLPPALVPEPWLSYDAIPWNAVFSPQRQLKRVADVAVALVLLLATAPLMLLAALLIWLEDRGPVFYVQERSGWLGEPFQVLKLRTMAVAPRHAPPRWTVPGDRRITRVGLWLRRTRLDELPQLINVLRGDMSLIGPRPERPELERDLEARIPHYRKRHWMRPGLSGWAQVCAPYAASVEDSELKLSYDLYYLKHFSTWLDLVILLRTIKTVLKVQGR
jgi:lipopolysaccharide/colanic/teichoic acid biosynthesis glycosyltransferase